VEVPREVLDVVPETFRTSGDHGRVRAGGVRVLRLGRLMVSEEKKRLPVRVSISRRLNIFLPTSSHHNNPFLGVVGQ